MRIFGNTQRRYWWPIKERKERRDTWEISEIYKVKYTKGLKNPVTIGNINPVKVSAIINMQELMIETRAWKRFRGGYRHVDYVVMFLRGHHITSGCKMLASKEYIQE